MSVLFLSSVFHHFFKAPAAVIDTIKKCSSVTSRFESHASLDGQCGCSLCLDYKFRVYQKCD